MKPLLISIALSAAVMGCCAQSLRLFFDSPPAAKPGDTVGLTLRAVHFSHIGSLQFGLRWDTAALRYAGAEALLQRVDIFCSCRKTAQINYATLYA